MKLLPKLCWLDIFNQISQAMGCDSPQQAIEKFLEMMKEMGIDNPVAENRDEELNVLSTSVNPVRLKNNPVLLSEEVIRRLYNKIVRL